MSTNKQKKGNRLLLVLAIALVATVCLIAKNIYKTNNSTIALVNPDKYLAPSDNDDEQEAQVGTVTVKYVDQNGNDIQAAETHNDGQLGEEYNFTHKTINGYVLDESKYPTNRRGNYSTKNQTVTFVYTSYDDEVETNSDGENVTITVLKNRNQEISKEYKFKIVKKDQSNNTLPGATFKVSRPNESILRWDKDYTGDFVVGTLIMDDTDTETYIIEENPAPTGYDGIASTVTLTITKETRDNEIFATASLSNVEGTSVSVNEEDKEIVVTITNQKQYESQDYSMVIETYDEEDNALPGAKYKVVRNDETDPIINALDDTGVFEVGTMTIDSEGSDEYTITQTPPALYDALSGDIVVTITKAKDSDTFKYVIADAEKNEIEGVDVTLDRDNKKVIVKVHNKLTPIEDETKDYTVYIKTVDEDGNQIPGSRYYGVDQDNAVVLDKQDTTGMLQIGTATVDSVGTDVVTIEQKTTPEGFETIQDKIKFTLERYLDEENHKYGANPSINTIEGVTLDVDQETGKIVITVKLEKTPEPPPPPKIFDLTIDKNVKFVEVTSGGKTTTIKKVGNKIVKIDIPKSKINGSVIKATYTLTVKNVGEIAGYALEVKDPVPSGMVLVEDGNWKVVDGEAITEKLADKLIKPGESESIDITYTWKVTEKDVGTKYNEALISKSGNDEDVPDVTPDQVAREPIILAVTTGNRAIITIEFVVALALVTGIVYVIRKKNKEE